ncbi:MAG: hypothetical protein EOP68_24375, partial [Sphingomonas sp.]
MIVPTQRAVALALVAAPLALLLGAVRPQGWLLAVAWTLGIAVMVLLDGLLARRIVRADLALAAPATAEVGDRVTLTGATAGLAYAVDVTPPLEPLPSRLREGDL